MSPDASLLRAKINSDYNDFVARVALEVVDSAWWKRQLRVKSAGSSCSTPILYLVPPPEFSTQPSIPSGRAGVCG
jgi:hypothetical protein